MNKYEKLMEYIINDQEDKAKALFHEIVIERSREIYESLMDEQDPAVQDDQVEGLVDEITADETGMHEAGDDLEMDAEPEMGGDDMGDMGDELGMDMGDEAGEAGEGELEDRVMDLEDAIDELKAEFDRIIGGGEAGDEEGGEEAGGEPHDEMNEAKEEDEEDEEEDDEEESVEESRQAKSAAEKLREYVDKVSDGHGAEKKGGAEGSEVGKAGSSVGVNKQSIVAGKNDMGGTAANIAKGGTETAPDGQAPKGAVKGKGEFTGQFQNKPGAKADLGKAPAAKKGDGQTTDGSVPVNKTSIESGRK